MSETSISDASLVANVRLCEAIKWHPCLYDASSKLYQLQQAVEVAWQSIANECDDTVFNCRLRWRIIRKCYMRSMQTPATSNNNPNALNRKTYYLNDYLEFLKPHLETLMAHEDVVDKCGKLNVKQLEDLTTEGGVRLDESTTQKVNDNDGQPPEPNTQKATAGANSSTSVSVGTEHTEVMEQVAKPSVDQLDEESATASETNDSVYDSGRPKRKVRPLPAAATTAVAGAAAMAEESDDNEEANSSSRYSRRLARTRKANTRYIEYDTFNKAKGGGDDKRKRSLDPDNSVDMKSEEKKSRVFADQSGQPVVKKLPGKQSRIKNSDFQRARAASRSPGPVQKPKATYKARAAPGNLNVVALETALSPKPPLADSFTEIERPHTRDVGTQCEEDVAFTYDNVFLESLKTQMSFMNSRQKFMFKRYVYQALVDVFDDPANFPTKDEVIELPPTGAPRFDTTTPAEMKLIHELVNLVTAAKTTPELQQTRLNQSAAATVNDLELVEPPAPLEQVTMPTQCGVVSGAARVTGAAGGAGAAGAAGIAVTAGAAGAVAGAGPVMTRTADMSTLPRHVLKKVVKVAGSSGGALLTHEGEARRVYRIYPKGTLPSSAGHSTTGFGNIGTFYINPPKTMPGTSSKPPNIQVGSVGFTKTALRNGSVASIAAPAAAIPPGTVAVKQRNQFAVSRQRVAVRSQMPLGGRRECSSATMTAVQNMAVPSSTALGSSGPLAAANGDRQRVFATPAQMQVQMQHSNSPELQQASGLSQIQISNPVSLAVNRTAVASLDMPLQPEDNGGVAAADENGEMEVCPYDPPAGDNESEAKDPLNADVSDGLLGTAQIKTEPLE